MKSPNTAKCDIRISVWIKSLENMKANCRTKNGFICFETIRQLFAPSVLSQCGIHGQQTM